MAYQSGGSFQPNEPVQFTNTASFTGATSITGALTATGGFSSSSTTFTTAPVNSYNAGTVAAATVTAVETGAGNFHTTVLTLTGLAMAISDVHVGGGTKIYTFPEGNITVLNATASVTETTTSTIASTLKATKTLSVGVGSVQTTTQDSGTLVTTEQDIVNAFSAVSSTTINTPGTGGTGKITATTLLRYDGTATPQAVYLNCGIPTATDIDADATSTWSGTVTITWVSGGDV